MTHRRRMAIAAAAVLAAAAAAGNPDRPALLLALAGATVGVLGGVIAGTSSGVDGWVRSRAAWFPWFWRLAGGVRRFPHRGGATGLCVRRDLYLLWGCGWSTDRPQHGSAGLCRAGRGG